MMIPLRGTPFARSSFATRKFCRTRRFLNLDTKNGEKILVQQGTRSPSLTPLMTTITSPQALSSQNIIYKNRWMPLRFSRRCLASTTESSHHPLDPLLPDEITQTSGAVLTYLGLTSDNMETLRFVSISLLEPPKSDYIKGIKTPRQAECIALREPLYRVETGNYEYRLVLRCR